MQVAVYDDPASVIVPEEVQTNGFHCLAGSPSCSLGGISLYDPDCEMAVDGSCYLTLACTCPLDDALVGIRKRMQAREEESSGEVVLRRLELNVTAGQLSIPGHPDGWQEHASGVTSLF